MPHLLDTANLSKQTLSQILKVANSFKFDGVCSSKKILKDKNVILAFFENSTRTISSFEIAALNLGANPVKLDIDKSSMSKGEALLDTLITLDAMQPECIVMRHKEDGIFKQVKDHINAKLLNAGEGKSAHPTQTLLDLLTILNHANKIDSKNHANFDYIAALDRVAQLKIALIGDVANSRVASSNIALLTSLGAHLKVIAPKEFSIKSSSSVEIFDDLESMQNLDYAMALRVQFERHEGKRIDAQKYAQNFCITKERLYKSNAHLMHPGPINANIDVAKELVYDERSLILEQVKNGVFIRMACYLYALDLLEQI